MERVPLDRRVKSVIGDDSPEVKHVVGAEVRKEPSPSAHKARNKVHGKAVLMRALPRARFTRLGGKEVVLPVGTAEALEGFEAGLRLAGFVREGEVLLQINKRPARFVVAKVQSSMNVRDTARDNFWRRVHDGSPFLHPKPNETLAGDEPASVTEAAQRPQSGRPEGRPLGTTLRQRRGLDK